MALNIPAIALFSPIAASSTVFSIRRASKGVNSMSDNPFYGTMNLDIAAGQSLKGARAMKELNIVNSSQNYITGASDAIKDLSKTSKTLSSIGSGIGKIIDFTSNNINPIIVTASGVKVLGSDDKIDTAEREGLALGAMFASEAAANRILGMPYTKKINGKKETFNREALYNKNPFIKKQISAMKDYCETKKLFNKIPLKMTPGILKGLTFVGASISGYHLGTVIADSILGEEKTEKS